MKHLNRIAISVLAILSTTCLYAQSQHSQNVNIGFKFYAAEKELPAGRYQLSQFSDDTAFVTLRNVADSSAVQLKVQTRLAREGTVNTDKVRLVFDKVGDCRHLSEIWLAGRDGLLVRTTLENHKHEVVR